MFILLPWPITHKVFGTGLCTSLELCANKIYSGVTVCLPHQQYIHLSTQVTKSIYSVFFFWLKKILKSLSYSGAPR